MTLILFWFKGQGGGEFSLKNGFQSTLEERTV
jgi:hypothetical protein